MSEISTGLKSGAYKKLLQMNKNQRASPKENILTQGQEWVVYR